MDARQLTRHTFCLRSRPREALNVILSEQNKLSDMRVRVNYHLLHRPARL